MRDREWLLKMEKFLVLGICFGACTGHTITSLWVPRWAEPGRAAELRCQYTRQPRDPPLHSVKWYRDNDEIFRYTPHETEGRSFNVSGVAVANSSCGARACAVRLHVDRGAARYTCEVSSEGPRFAVDKRSAEMALAVLPEYDPLITNLPLVLYPGEEVLVNCTADYSLPPAEISWFLDDEPVTDAALVGSDTHVSGADGEGLRAAWRTLRLAAGARAAARGLLQLRCVATLPTRPPHARSVPVWLHVGAAPQVAALPANGNVLVRPRFVPRTLVTSPVSTGEAVVAAGAGAARAAGRTRAPTSWTFVLLLTTKCLHV